VNVSRLSASAIQKGAFGYVWNGVKKRFSQLDDSVATPHRLAGQKLAPKDAGNCARKWTPLCRKPPRPMASWVLGE